MSSHSVSHALPNSFDVAMSSKHEKSPAGEKDAASHNSSFKFRFKSKRKDRDERLRSCDSSEPSRRDSKRSRHCHNRHRHQSKRRKHSIRDDPSFQDDPEAQILPSVDPDAAFRESLFDAMADDEGAQFWEGVYGQPIHNYSDMKQGSTGELERMTDEEYTAFVRAKMYERTHQHLIEEKARRDAARKERQERAREGAKAERESEIFRRKVEESLRRGEERKSRKLWMDKWNTYLEKWRELSTKPSHDTNSKVFIATIPWPVESGKRIDISRKEVERFFLYAPTSGQPTEAQLQKTLKLERLRWHPDKIQQKLGGQDVSEEVIQAVTEVFQVIDHLWSEVRNNEV